MAWVGYHSVEYENIMEVAYIENRRQYRVNHQVWTDLLLTFNYELRFSIVCLY